ncbi:hypothetical protein HMPREF2531_02704 [Bacteroides intestinalis]|uniref:Uncharacterized protein n=1 Tax=Bacteroides intestinalis TaxID=329854 RepID=A0A139LBM1_9BACE|nr:hypothetical protein HMPREF2531_02704 [Bacteroides intestinalis]
MYISLQICAPAHSSQRMQERYYKMHKLYQTLGKMRIDMSF